ncbi:MAG: hypothetical protein PHY72_01230 [Candidatus Pacebacteria bacterium]|nr:hypothetical protein [Candidatus Paceibacterota bacterium]
MEHLTDQGAEQILIERLKGDAEAEGFTHYTVGVMSKSLGSPEILDSYGGWTFSIMAYREEVI